jgi:hypothetical protein
MTRTAAIEAALRAGFAAVKAVWLRWHICQRDAAGSIFQRRIDPLSGRSRDWNDYGHTARVPRR